MSKKDVSESRAPRSRSDVLPVVSNYLAYHDNAGGSSDSRKSGYADMVGGYYDLATDLYERGWGESFHFAPRYRGEPFRVSAQRYQHFLSLRLGISAGDRVLDVGCGVGGPMRELARTSGAHITGVNINGYQVRKVREYNRLARLEHQCDVLEADFMEVPLPNGCFDAAFSFEATCHAPDKTALFRELHRLLRPGGKLGIYEWCLTDRYNAEDPEHVRLKRDIEEGNGLPDIWTFSQTWQCFEDAGFKILAAQDRADEGNREVPWYLSLSGRELSNTGLRRSPIGKLFIRALTRSLEAVRVAPKGTSRITEFLNVGADALVSAGERGLFTPMAFFLAEKPMMP